MTTTRAQPPPHGPVLRFALSLPAWLYRARLGRLLGHRFLMLTHRGRVSGRLRVVVLEVVAYDRQRDESVVVAGWGKRTQWRLNVEVGGAVRVTTGGDSFPPSWRFLDGDEGARILGDYERRNRLIRPIVRRVLSGLLGWQYDGSAAARRDAAEQLGLMSFRPADGPAGSEAATRPANAPPAVGAGRAAPR